MFTKILIANRGEIACRVMRTAKRLGIRTVAVYSDADRDALHVRTADEAVHIGPAPARQSYLDGAKIIETAKRIGAEAIHPGYGFLSENAGFAEACAGAGITFIGPPAAAIRAMGGKSESKALMVAAGVPVVPGYHGEDQDPGLLAAEADKIGFPVLIKASAGGGGKGMKVAESAAGFAAQLASARREAKAAFGDDRVLLERYVTRPRHVEIQVFADRHGNAIHLFERDCSIQRRHQKVIEEAPAPDFLPELRTAMGAAAVTAAKAIGYEGAGTVEFLYEPATGSFFFMEMNTRLQVEHPVTEMVTGLDLVEWQLRIAAGEALPLRQDGVAIRGHAIEARIYAEDPNRDFLPQTGRLDHLRFPAPGPHVRVDSAVAEGDRISVYYDPMIAKLIAWDETREAACRRLSAALRETELVGLNANVAFLQRLADHPAFRAGEVDTGFIERHRAALLPGPEPAPPRALALAALRLLLGRGRGIPKEEAWSPWARGTAWRMNLPALESLLFRDVAGNEWAVTIEHRRGGWRLTAAEDQMDMEGRLLPDGGFEAEINGRRTTAMVVGSGADLVVFADGQAGGTRLHLVDPVGEAGGDEAVAGGLTAPMPGRVIAHLVAPGTEVAAGAPVLVLEAMKMEHTLKTPAAGRVVRFRNAVGEQVAEGAELVEFEPAK